MCDSNKNNNNNDNNNQVKTFLFIKLLNECRLKYKRHDCNDNNVQSNQL